MAITDKLKKIDKDPTKKSSIKPDKEKRVSTALNENNQMVYVWDDKEIISDADGFGMLAGKIPVPKKLTSYISMPRHRHNSIFNKTR